ncbi:Peptide deformylase [Capnocytophaga ochracea]|nr:Peptide deformylase [Capnocytophaga ochracea]
MNAAYGVGLAAPQVGLSIRLFVVDASPFADDDELSEEEQTFLKGFKKTFINAKIVEETGDTWNFNEGCLSIPGVREDVSRHKQITIEYFDEDFNKQTLTIGGLAARIIQHEYDHIEGILFTDKLSSFKRQLIKSKLTNISKGKVKVDYRMKFFDAKNKR